MLQEKMREAFDVPGDTANYTSMRGYPPFSQAVADFLTSHAMRGVPMDPAHLCISAGCGAVIHLCGWCLCGPGDAVLIPAPAYPAFDNDLTVQAEAIPIHLPLTAPRYRITRTALDAGFERAMAAGHIPRVLLLTSPNNPLGRLYTPQELELCVTWCTERGLHLVSDEIYAHSVYAPLALPEPRDAEDDAEPSGVGAEVGEAGDVTEAFESVAALCMRKLGEVPPNVHVVWGFSKDFGVSGFRVGCLYTRNPQLLKAWDTLGYFHAVSNDMQARLATVLSDTEFVDALLARNRELLRDAARLVHRELSSLPGVRVLPSQAGMFCWVDMRTWLRGSTWEGERALFNAMFERARVLMTPGQDCHASEPGFFRVCTVWMPPEAISQIPVRLRKLAAELGIAGYAPREDTDAMA